MKRLIKIFKRFYYNLPINMKLNFTNILIIVVSMGILTLLANQVTTNIIIDKSVASSVQDLNVIKRSMDSLFNQIEYLSKLTVTNNNVQAILHLSKEEINFEQVKRLDVVRSLDTIVGNEDIINSALVFTNEGIVISSSKVGNYKLSVDSKDLTSIIEAAERKKGEVIWRRTQPVDYYLGKENIDCISLFRALIDVKTGDILGAIELDVDQNNISSLFSNRSNNKSEEVFIVSDDGMVIFTGDKDSLYKKVDHENYYNWVKNNNNSGKVFNIENERYLVTSVRYERFSSNIIGVVPLKHITEDSEKITYLIFIVGLICISLAVITSIINSLAITRPIIRLSRNMAQASQGDLEVRSTIAYRDEVGQLATSFNNMIERISELMDKVYREEKKKREYEFLALQSQINPHFLYNTLESICSLANKQRTEDVTHMVKSLENFYRTALSNGRNVVTIREEIENVSNYLNIQKVRYKDKINYVIEVDENILNMSIVKLSIQPLVENSIYHGIRNKMGKGMIWIFGTVVGEKVRISVIDDGVGFDENRYNSMIKDSDDKRKSYGLKNVNERTKLYFGPEYGLNITSSKKSGTRVDVILPSVDYKDQGEEA